MIIHHEAGKNKENIMRLGLETFSYHLAFRAGTMNVLTFIERCVSLGLEGVQLNTGHMDDFLREDTRRVRQIRELAAGNNLFVEVDTRGTDPGPLADRLRLCRDLGADVLRTYASCGGDLAEELACAPDQLRSLIPMCEELGIRIALENHEYETSSEIVEIVQQVDNEWVGTHVDTGNSMLVWEEPVNAVRAMAPLAVSTHFKDHIVIMEDGQPLVLATTLGRGNIDCRECLRILATDSSLDRLVIEDCYGYSAPFRRPEVEGAGGRLGEGSFRVVDGPLDPTWALLHPREAPPEEMKKYITWQEASVIRSIDFVKGLLKELPAR